ncbi:SAM-dependent methyltransferase [Candidatus Poribacteria bacterium]|nr:MAG: SAM-dependent methyltransferase [Candidatus Poribacteria bacterium]
MIQTDTLQRVLGMDPVDLHVFRRDEIQVFNKGIFPRRVNGELGLFIDCPIRKKEVQLDPEEYIRQLYARRLLKVYKYPKDRLKFEYPIRSDQETKRADIVVLGSDPQETPYIIVEIKKSWLLAGKAQLRSYCNATGASIGVWTNGQQMFCYRHKSPNYFEEITDIPTAEQTLADVLNAPFTLKNLILKDKLVMERRSLKDILLELEDEVLANAGVNVFEEVLKLIFTKLYDEFKSQKDQNEINRHLLPLGAGHIASDESGVAEIQDDNFRRMQFRNTGQTDTELQATLQRLFDDARNQWPGIFPEISTFKLSDRHMSICVSSLQNTKLLNADLQGIEDAFEHLLGQRRGGLSFTPRPVVDMCVKMLNPKRGESMIDPAAGTGRFPIHTVFKMTGTSFIHAKIPTESEKYISKVFGIDFSETAVRVARVLNLIAENEETNILPLNVLDYERWDDIAENYRGWSIAYGEGFQRLKALRAAEDGNRYFNFDILMGHPPFGGPVKEHRILHQYKLGSREKREHPEIRVKREALFIERSLDLLKPGGRMAMLLPQSFFNTTAEKFVRDFIVTEARILGVVGLHANTFRPDASLKTSVLFLQKWNDDPEIGPLCPRVDDYPTFLATSEQSGKDNAGNYIYRTRHNGSTIVEHDLHNHEGKLSDGIAEAFIEWAKREGLSFWS